MGESLMSHTMRPADFRVIQPHLTVPVGMEAYAMAAEAWTVHGETETTLATQGSDGPCRLCLLKVFPGDKARWVKLRKAGSLKAGAKIALVHEACMAAFPRSVFPVCGNKVEP